MLAEDLDSRQHVPGREVRFLEAVLQYRWSTPCGAEFRKDFKEKNQRESTMNARGRSQASGVHRNGAAPAYLAPE